MELDEHCFNYGIELINGNIALCSEDSTINIIKLFYDNDNKKIIQIKDNKHYSIIQKIDLEDEPFYIIKELKKGELIIGGWNHLVIFAILPYSDKYELINKVFIEDRTFSLIELFIGEIISSQYYSKTLTIYNIYEAETKIIYNIESNKNPNTICKYNDKNEIVLVAYKNGINIVSVINKFLIQKIALNDIVSSLCPLNIFKYTKKGRDEKEIFTLLIGTKKKVFSKEYNYIYNIKHIGFNLFDENVKNEIIYDTEGIENKVYLISEKEAVHYNEIKQINVIERNNFFSVKDKTQKKENKFIISMGSEDKRLIFWEKIEKEDNKSEYINELKNQNFNLRMEIEQLKNKLNKEKKMIYQFKKETNKKITELENYNKKIEKLQSIFPFKISEDDKIITTIFMTSDQNIYYSMICKSTEKFIELEKRLYIKFPEYKEVKKHYYANGHKIDVNKTIEDNKIKDNEIIIIYNDNDGNENIL